MEKAAQPKGYFGGVKLASGRIKAVSLNSKTYCSGHIAVCKICGKTLPALEAKKCRTCGGTYCPDCGSGGKCLTCSQADEVTAENYKSISSGTRLLRLNALPFSDKFHKTAVIEDNENIVFVTIKKSGKTVRRYSKLTQKMAEGNKSKKSGRGKAEDKKA